MKIENRTELKEYRIECQKKQSADCRVLVCGGTGCLASGSGKIYEKLKELTKDHTGVEVKIGEEIAHTKAPAPLLICKWKLIPVPRMLSPRNP